MPSVGSSKSQSGPRLIISTLQLVRMPVRSARPLLFSTETPLGGSGGSVAVGVGVALAVAVGVGVDASVVRLMRHELSSIIIAALMDRCAVLVKKGGNTVLCVVRGLVEDCRCPVRNATGASGEGTYEGTHFLKSIRFTRRAGMIARLVFVAEANEALGTSASTLPARDRGLGSGRRRFRGRWRGAAILRAKLCPGLRWMRDARSNFPPRRGSSRG